MVDDDARLADDKEPDVNLCQNCSTEFDWSEDECPNCGWSKSEWVKSGRYGLAKS